MVPSASGPTNSVRFYIPRSFWPQKLSEIGILEKPMKSMRFWKILRRHLKRQAQNEKLGPGRRLGSHHTVRRRQGVRPTRIISVPVCREALLTVLSRDSRPGASVGASSANANSPHANGQRRLRVSGIGHSFISVVLQSLDECHRLPQGGPRLSLPHSAHLRARH